MLYSKKNFWLNIQVQYQMTDFTHTALSWVFLSSTYAQNIYSQVLLQIKTRHTLVDGCKIFPKVIFLLMQLVELQAKKGYTDFHIC